jgi:hypothetical protein
VNQSLELLSGRIKVVAPLNVAADRYSFLGLDQAEPNLGVSPTSAYVLATNEYGVRRWAPFNEVGVIGPTGPTGATGPTGPTGDRYTTFSTDTFSIPNTFPSYLEITVETLLSYIPSQEILIAYDYYNYFTGKVIDYNSISGLLQLSALSAGAGSGSYSYWEVSLNGSIGAIGPTGSTGIPGPVGASYFPDAVSYLFIEPFTTKGKVVSGTDQYGKILKYNSLLPNNVNVYKNGSRLTNNYSFTANDGANIFLDTTLITSDKVEVVVVSGKIDYNPDIFTRNDLQKFRYTVGFDPLTSIPSNYYTVSGYDDTNRLLEYIPGNIIVSKNGINLVEDLDYNAVNGSTITLSGKLNIKDVISVQVLSAFNFAPYKNYWVSQVINYFYTVPTANIPVGALVVSGTDTYGKNLNYFPQAVDVFVNGVNLVNVADFIATNEKDVILNVPLLYGDTIQIKTLSAFGTQPPGPIGPTGPTGAAGIGDQYNTTSSSTVTIPSIFNTYVEFTLNDSNLSYVPSQFVIASRDINNTIYGLVSDYSTATNGLTVLALSAVGSGNTYSNWAINLNAIAGPRGAQGATGSTGATGAIGPTGATGPIAGSTKQFIYNNAGSPAGAQNLIYDGGYVGVGTTNPQAVFHARSSTPKNAGSHILLEASSSASVNNNADTVTIKSSKLNSSSYKILDVLNTTGSKFTVFGDGNINIASNLTVVGDLSALGNTTFIDSKIVTSSAVVILNSGTGPALSVTQTGSQPLATFIDKESGIALHIQDTGLVGIGLSASSEKLTVLGNISASDTIIGTRYVSAGQELFGLINNTILPIDDSKVMKSQIAVLSTAQEFTAFHGVSATKLNNAVTFGVNGVSADWNLDQQQVTILTLSSTPVFIKNPTNMRPGGTYMLIVKQDSIGNRVLNFQSNYKFVNSVAPTITTAPSSVDIFSFISDGKFLYGVGSQGYI